MLLYGEESNFISHSYLATNYIFAHNFILLWLVIGQTTVFAFYTKIIQKEESEKALFLLDVL